MILWYMTALVITTMTPSQGWMQYNMGFEDRESCIEYLVEPGVKPKIAYDLRKQMGDMLIKLDDYTCMTRDEAIEKNGKLGHGSIDT